MSFKKTKLQKENTGGNKIHLDSIRDHYIAIKKRNFFSSILLGCVGLFVVAVVSFATFSHLGSFNFDFSFPFIGKSNITETVGGSSENKINILVTGMGGGEHE